MKPVLTTTLLMTLGISATLQAEEEESMYRIGGLVQWESEVYQEADSEASIYPWLYLRSGRWEFDRKDLKYHLIDNDTLSFAPLLSLELDGYEADDSPILAGMEDRDFSLGLGFAAEVEWEFLEIETSVRRDVLDNSDGIIADLGLGIDGPISNRLFAGVEIGVNYQDSDYSNYYYGVLPTEATATRAAYEPGSTLNPFIQINVFYQLNKNWVLAGMLERTQFDSAIKDSPIVDSSGETMLMFGIAYQGFF